MKEYAIQCDPNYLQMFVVMVKCNGFWQQVGHRYTYKKNAQKYMAKLQAKG